MAIKRTKRNMCFILLISILLFGTCLGTVQTGSLSAHAFPVSSDVFPNEDTSINSAGKTLPLQPYLVRKDSVNQETSVHIKRSSQKVRLHSGKSASVFLSAAELFRNEKRILFFLTVNSFVLMLLSHMIIIGYIHHQDGQKPYIPFSFTY